MSQLTIQQACQLAFEHYQARRFPPAAEMCLKILGVAPEHAGVMRLLGMISHDLGRHAVAVDWLSRATAFNPSSPETHYNLAVALEAAGERDKAISAYRTAIKLKPEYAAACNNLGIALHDSSRFAKAVAAFSKAIAIRPEHAEGYANLANSLKALGQLDQAIAAYRTAISLQKDYPQAHNNLGNALKIKGDIDGAIAAYRTAIALSPHDAEIHSNLGNALKDKGQLVEAITAYEEAIKLQPHCAEFHGNLAVALLIGRRFKDGWREYEWRWQPADVPAPAWNGSPLAGRTILVRAEQGFGDIIQFARYVPLIACGGNVIFQCPGELTQLLQHVEGMESVRIIGRRVTAGAIPPYDVHVSLMSLPLVLGLPEPAGELSRRPYIRIHHPLQQLPRVHPAHSDRLKIGIAWAGAQGHPSDARRSVSLRTLAPLLRCSADFYSLQVGNAASQNWNGSGLIDLAAQCTDFLATAELISQLDLVVSVDTSVAHLAAAMGTPTWVLLSHAPDWRWGLGCEETPWYPGMKLFRQMRLGDWNEVISRLVQAIESRINQREQKWSAAA